MQTKQVQFLDKDLLISLLEKIREITDTIQHINNNTITIYHNNELSHHCYGKTIEIDEINVPLLQCLNALNDASLKIESFKDKL